MQHLFSPSLSPSLLIFSGIPHTQTDKKKLRGMNVFNHKDWWNSLHKLRVLNQRGGREILSVSQGTGKVMDLFAYFILCPGFPSLERERERVKRGGKWNLIQLNPAFNWKPRDRKIERKCKRLNCWWYESCIFIHISYIYRHITECGESRNREERWEFWEIFLLLLFLPFLPQKVTGFIYSLIFLNL